MTKYLSKKDKWLYYLEIVMLLVHASLEIGLAFVMLMCVDLAQNGNLADAPRYLLLFVLYIVVFFFVDYLSRRLKWHLLKNAKVNLRNRLYEKIIYAKSEKFRSMNTGEWMSVMTNDVDIVEGSHFKETLNLIVDVAELTVSLILVFWISPYLALFTLAIVGIQMLLPRYFAPKLGEKKREFSKAAEQFTKNVSEGLNAYDTIREFHIYQEATSMVRAANEEVGNHQFLSRLMSSTSNLVSFTMGNILYIGIYFFGAVLAVMGQVSVAEMIAASQLIVYISAPLIQLSTSLAEIKSAKVVFDKFEDILDLEGENQENYEHVEAFNHSIVFDKVSFRYSQDDQYILRNANLSFDKGKKYLLKGDSGSGKSTILKLAKGILTTSEGSIRLDGKSVNTIAPESIAKLVAYNAQASFVFDASLRENITLFQKGFSDDEIMKALRCAGLEEAMKENKWSLDTIIQESGVNFSGGEKQRMALARMFLTNAPIVFLDESFANIDQSMTRKIMDEIVKEQDKTVVFISHQSDQMIGKYFDQVISLEDGSIYYN